MKHLTMIAAAAVGVADVACWKLAPVAVFGAVVAAQAIAGAFAMIRAARGKRFAIAAVVSGLPGIVALMLAASMAGCGYYPYGAWGRPLRIKGRIVQPEIRITDEWASGAAPDVAALSPSVRETLAAWWLRDAQKEHASVPAFARLAWQLAALGAPAALLERAYRAGLQEIRHARRCFALVSAYRGEPCGATAMPELAAGADGATSLVSLATESLVDGCVIEGVNADAAELALSRATDPAVVSLLRTIAVDERSHAELAWDIVAWCARTGGAPVTAALSTAAAAIPTQGDGLYDPELARLVAGCDVADLHAHGRVPLADWPALYAMRLADTRARLGALVQGNTAASGRSSVLRSPRASWSSV